MVQMYFYPVEKLLETLVIYSVCKCDTRPSVKYLMREENERFGEDF